MYQMHSCTRCTVASGAQLLQICMIDPLRVSIGYMENQVLAYVGSFHDRTTLTVRLQGCQAMYGARKESYPPTGTGKLMSSQTIASGTSAAPNPTAVMILSHHEQFREFLRNRCMIDKERWAIGSARCLFQMNNVSSYLSSSPVLHCMNEHGFGSTTGERRQ